MQPRDGAGQVVGHRVPVVRRHGYREHKLVQERGSEHGEEEDSHLGDFIEDKSVVSPAEAVINMNLAEQTRKVLKTLTPREEKVLRMRFGIGEKSDHTLEEVGQDFEVTRERIRQIEAKALRKMRHPTRIRQLEGFLEAHET